MPRKRRGRGEGSVYQRADGVWTAAVNLGLDDRGKRKRRTVYGSSKAAVQVKLQELQVNVGRGLDVGPQRVTVARWLDYWLAHIKPTVENSTYDGYEIHVRRHLKPHVGTVVLAKLAAVHVKGLYSSLTAAGVSPAMQRKIGVTLSVALNYAVRCEVVPTNAASKVKKPKAAKPEIQVLAPDQLAAFLEAAKGDRLYPFFVAAVDSGARPGELFALEWGDVDFDGGFLSISKSLEDLHGIQRVKAVKTARGRRRIDLSAGTVTALAEHRKAALAAGRIDAPVFHSPTGGYLRLSNVYRDAWRPALAKAGLAPLGLYSLRHTCATLLLLAGEPAKVVSERLGHATVSLTLDTYSHVLPAMQKRAADAMGAILDAARGLSAERRG